MELVDKKVLLAEIENNHWEDADPKDIAMQIVLSAPTVEAAPVVHGKWIEVNPDICKCSVCGEYSCARKYYDKQEDIKTEFCPDCGAKME